MVAALIGIAGCVGQSPPPVGAALRGAPAILDPSVLRRDLGVLAADSMRGRETGSPEAVAAARFIGERLVALGLEPLGDSMFYQRVPMLRQILSPGSRVTVSGPRGTTALRLGEDVAAMMTLGEGQPDPRRFVSADVVFLGYAGRTPAVGRDDLASVDCADRVAVFLHGAPPGVSGPIKDSLDSDAEMGRQLARVAARKPAAMVVLMTGGARRLYRELYPSLTRDVHARVFAAPSIPGVEIPMLLFGEARAGSPLLPPTWPADDRAQALPGVQLTASLVPLQQQIVGYNVVARVPGTDQRLKNTYVAFGAHYDHIGVLPPVNDDSIANGADDDGSGTVALLEIARALSQHPMKRSALIVWHVGEEKGLLGSQYFTDHPTIPLDSVVAQLNADMIGRNAPDSLYLVGPRAAPNGQARRLGEIIDSVNRASGRPFAFDRSWDDANHPLQIYQRSDHFSYARKGIPIAFFTSGMHADYHAVSDEVSRIDFDKLSRVARLMLDVGYAIGNAPTRPR
ncbi:MAG TPA: M28 family peptidase [Gemmatimonadaceae bacterium]